MVMEKRIFEMALSLLSGIGPVKAKMLVAHTGSAEAVFKENERALSRINGIGTAVAKSLNRVDCLARAEKELGFIEKYGINLHYFQDENYPAKLRQCEDGPVVLFSKGSLNFNRKNIAVVGTRKASTYGKTITKKFIEDLAPYGVQIVSGLAYGIDVEAHRAAMDNGLSTLAVLGHGLDIIYPAAHKSVARQMLENGGLVTEYLSQSPRDTSNFPKRNRVVAGLCDATVVVESAVSGGSLITANLANDYNRDVFAFPGNVDLEYSRGCNALIQQQKAHLITSASDLVKLMGWEEQTHSATIQPQLFPELTEQEDRIVTLLQHLGESHIDALGIKAEMPASLLSLNLFNLEMKGIIQAIPGKIYRLN